MPRDSFILHMRHAKVFERLTDEQSGRLIKAVFDYEMCEVEQTFDDPVLEIAFIYIRDQLDYDKGAYERKCKRNSENAKKRWRGKSEYENSDRIITDAKPCLYEDEDEDEDEDVNEDGDEKEDKDVSEMRESETRALAGAKRASKAVEAVENNVGGGSEAVVSSGCECEYAVKGETGLTQKETGHARTQKRETKEKVFLQPLRGRYENVRLTAFDEATLKLEFPDDLEARIERLSEYIATHGDKYYNHAAVIRSWSKNGRDQPAKSTQSPPSAVSAEDDDDYENNEYMQAAMARSMRYLEEMKAEEGDE